MSTDIQEYNVLEKLRSEGFGGEGFLTFLSGRKEKKFKLLKATLQDPQYQSVPIHAICNISGVDFIELERAWIDYNRQRGLVKMAAQLPEVMEDVAVDARSVVSQCRNCDGLGRLEAQADFPICPICNGKGAVRSIGDRHSRDLLFETMKLTSKEPTVQVNNNFSLEGLVGDAAKILKSSSTIDVEAQ